MTSDAAIDLLREALVTIFVLAAPILVVLLVSGLLVGAMQSMTSIHDPTIAIVPRLAIGCVVLLCLLPWIIDRLSEFSVGLFRISSS